MQVSELDKIVMKFEVKLLEMVIIHASTKLYIWIFYKYSLNALFRDQHSKKYVIILKIVHNFLVFFEKHIKKGSD
jgi:hypothetical protein